MCQLTQRVVLIHELGELRRSKELFDSCSYRFNIDQGLCGDALRILSSHTLTYHSFQTGKTDTVLVLKQLADRTDTTVAQMVDIIWIADAAFQMHVVVDGSDDIFLRNVLRNQVMDISADNLF